MEIRSQQLRSSNFNFQMANNDKLSGQTTDTVDFPLKGKKICLDAGHGGVDPGATGITGLKEKEVNLNVSLYTKDILQTLGAEVLMTREIDNTVSLQERADLANNNKADLFVAIHANSMTTPDKHGMETYWHTAGDENDKKIAGLAFNHLKNDLPIYGRGVYQANFFVLRETTMPATLEELAYLSNKEDEALLKDPEFQKKAAQATSKAIVDYFKKLDKERKEQEETIANYTKEVKLENKPFADYFNEHKI